MELDVQLYVTAGVLGAVCLLLFILVLALFVQVSSLEKKVKELQNGGRLRVQKLKIKDDKNHAFHNPGLVPDEELSRRGYSMYQPNEVDVESQRHERQPASQQTFVDELTRELDSRQRSTAPPFLLKAIQENKQKKHLSNPVSNERHISDTNPNFIY